MHYPLIVTSVEYIVHDKYIFSYNLSVLKIMYFVMDRFHLSPNCINL